MRPGADGINFFNSIATLQRTEIMHSDWLKIVIWLGTANHSAFLLLHNHITLKFVLTLAPALTYSPISTFY